MVVAEAAVAVVAVDEKVTGRAKAAATQTFHGETNATDAKNRKVTVPYISHNHNVHLRPKFTGSLKIRTILLICFHKTIM